MRFQQYDDKPHKSLMVELLQLVDKKVFASVEAGKMLPEQLKKSIRSFMFMEEKFTCEVEFLMLKVQISGWWRPAVQGHTRECAIAYGIYLSL